MRYQIVMRPLATATGDPGTWSFWAHGARSERKEANETCDRLKGRGFATRLLPC